MLHNVCTKPNFVCLVATPYENQIRLIFTRLKELVDCSPKIKASVIKCTQSPYNMTLNNNSRILLELQVILAQLLSVVRNVTLCILTRLTLSSVSIYSNVYVKLIKMLEQPKAYNTTT